MENAPYAVELVSLNNVCLAFLERRKAGLVPFYLIEEMPLKIKHYWKDDPQGTIPCIVDIHKAYTDVLEAGLCVPEEIKELYQSAITKKGAGKGRAKESLTEHAFRGMYAITLSAIAEFERSTKAGFFPIKTHADARRIFYKQVLHEDFTESKNGGKDAYYIVLNAKKNKAEITLIFDILKKIYEKGQFPKEKPMGMPTVEAVAYWGRDLITQHAWLGNPWKKKK